MTSRKVIEAGNAIGFGGKPGKPPMKLKPEPQRPRPNTPQASRATDKLRTNHEGRQSYRPFCPPI